MCIVVTKYEWVLIFYDEDCRENDEKVEWNIASKHVGWISSSNSLEWIE